MLYRRHPAGFLLLVARASACALFHHQIPKLNSKEKTMPSLSSKDRVSLCRFTFDDGRRCRAPRISTSPDFCFYHAKKEAQFRANEKIGKDLAFFFSGDYLSANDLNTALSRVFVAQTMLQTLHLAQNEFISACGNSEWRDSVINSMNGNYEYRFPSPSQSAPPQPQTPAPASPQSPTPPPPAACPPVYPDAGSERSEGPQLDSPSPITAETHAASAEPTIPTLHATSSPVGAGLARPAPPNTRAASQKTADPNQPATQTPKPAATPAAQSAPPPPPATPSRPATQTRDPYAVHYGPNCRLLVDGKPF